MPKPSKSTAAREKPIGVPEAPLRDFLKAQKKSVSVSLLVTNLGRYLHATVYSRNGRKAVADTFPFLRLRGRLDTMLRTYRLHAKNEDITISLDCISHYTLVNFKESKSVRPQEIMWIDDIDGKSKHPTTFERFTSIVCDQSQRSVLTETIILAEQEGFRAILEYTDEALGENDPEVRQFILPKNSQLLKRALKLLKENTYTSFLRMDISIFKAFRLVKLEKAIDLTEDDIPFD